LLVSASSDESCNMPMIEANACGIPALVFDCRGDYSDHCEYIKYGIVVTDKEDIESFKLAMDYLEHYNLCTRYLKINCIAPINIKWKFYDFPISYAEFMTKNSSVKLKLSVKEFHLEGMRIRGIL